MDRSRSEEVCFARQVRLERMLLIVAMALIALELSAVACWFGPSLSRALASGRLEGSDLYHVGALLFSFARIGAVFLASRTWVTGGLWFVIALYAQRAIGITGSRVWGAAALALVASALIEVAAPYAWATIPHLGALAPTAVEVAWGIAQILVLEGLRRSLLIGASERGAGPILRSTIRSGQAVVVIGTALSAIGVGLPGLTWNAPWIPPLAFGATACASITMGLLAWWVAVHLRRAILSGVVWSVGSDTLECASCSHPLPASGQAAPACPECGLALRLSALLHRIARTTAASGAWRRRVRHAVLLLAASLCGSILLCAAQAIEAAYPLVGWQSLGSAGWLLRFTLQLLVLLAALRLLQAGGARIVAWLLLGAGALELLVLWLERGAPAPLTSRGGASPSGLMLVGLATHAAIGVSMTWLLGTLGLRVGSRRAVAGAAAMLVAFAPLAIVTLSRFPTVSGNLTGGLDQSLRRDLAMMEAWAPWIAIVGRHAWEVPALAAMWALLSRLRKPWLGYASAPREETP